MRRKVSLHKVVLFHTYVCGKETDSPHPEKNLILMLTIWLVSWNKSPCVTVKLCTSAFNLAYHEIFANIFWNLPFYLLSEKDSVTGSVLWWSVKHFGLLFSVVFVCSSINVKVLRCKRWVFVILYSCWCAWAASSYWGVLWGQWGDLPWYSFFHSLGKEMPSLELDVTSPAQQNSTELPKCVCVFPISRVHWTVITHGLVLICIIIAQQWL